MGTRFGALLSQFCMPLNRQVDLLANSCRRRWLSVSAHDHLLRSWAQCSSPVRRAVSQRRGEWTSEHCNAYQSR